MPRIAPTKPNPAAAIKPIDHERALMSSTELTSWWYESVSEQKAGGTGGTGGTGGKIAMQIKPQDVIAILNKAEIRFVLMGAHAMAGWLRGEARATRDVDILVRKQHHKKAVQAIREAFPHLTIEDNPVVTRFTDPQLDCVVIDLMKPKHDIHAAVFENTIPGGKTHEIPSLEMALASKFAAMVSPNRESRRKHIDAGDFSTIASFNRDKIDREKLRIFGDLVHPGGGADLVSLVDDALAGRVLKL